MFLQRGSLLLCSIGRICHVATRSTADSYTCCSVVQRRLLQCRCRLEGESGLMCPDLGWKIYGAGLGEER